MSTAKESNLHLRFCSEAAKISLLKNIHVMESNIKLKIDNNVPEKQNVLKTPEPKLHHQPLRATAKS